MATHQLKQEADEGLDLDDFMAELDRDLKKSASDKPKVKRVATPVVAPFQVQWHPFGVKFLLRRQTCKCGAEFQQIDGLYKVDMTKNGATRTTRAEGPLPAPYKHYAPTHEEEHEIIPSCPWCYVPEPMPATEPQQLPAKPLSKEDRDSLKDLDKLLDE